MLDAFLRSTKLRITYRVNSILYGLKHLPILREVLPESLYNAGWLKVLALVLAIFSELSTFFLGKLIYLAVFFAPAVTNFYRERSVAPGGLFLHIFFFLTLMGALFNNFILESDANSFYAIFLMRMDARRYALSNYIYYLIKTAVGFAGTLTLFYFIALAVFTDPEISPLWILLLPLFVVSAKLVAAMANVALFRRKKKMLNGRYYPNVMVTLTILTLLLAYGLPFLGMAIPRMMIYVVCGIAMAGAAPSAIYLLRSNDYRRIYRANPYTAGSDKEPQQAVQEAYRKKLVLEAGQDSTKSGCAYLNDLFVQRHRKMLRRTALRIALALTALLTLAVIICLLDRELAGVINERLMNSLPYFLFLMYLINRGQTITQILFFCCDHSLLAYRFYRQPKVILDLFKARLGTVVSINLVPGAVIAAGLPVLLLVSGGSKNPLDYLILLLSILSMSVFFSVHHLVLYYLLQPYTAGLESKSPAYFVISGLTYGVCYLGGTRLGGLISPLLFGGILIGFCLLYIVAALLLSYKLAPKTFKLRQ